MTTTSGNSVKRTEFKPLPKELHNCSVNIRGVIVSRSILDIEVIGTRIDEEGDAVLVFHAVCVDHQTHEFQHIRFALHPNNLRGIHPNMGYMLGTLEVEEGDSEPG